MSALEILVFVTEDFLPLLSSDVLVVVFLDEEKFSFSL